MPAIVVGLVEVEAQTDCPTAAEVAAELRPLLGEAGANERDRATLAREGGELRLSLRAPSGKALGERRLRADAPCRELASAAAVVIAAWETELHSGVVPSLPSRATNANAAVNANAASNANAAVNGNTAVNTNTAVNANAAATVNLNSNAAANAAVNGNAAIAPAHEAEATARARRGVAWDVGVGFVGALAGADFAPGGSIEATVGPRGSGFGARAFAWGTARREVALGAGQVAYTRAGLSLGGRYRLRARRFRFDLHAEAAVALLSVGGAGFASDASALDVDPGLGGGVRASVRVGRLEPFVGATFVGWLRRQQATVTGLAATADLPRWDVLLGAGLAFGSE